MHHHGDDRGRRGFSGRSLGDVLMRSPQASQLQHGPAHQGVSHRRNPGDEREEAALRCARRKVAHVPIALGLCDRRGHPPPPAASALRPGWPRLCQCPHVDRGDRGPAQLRPRAAFDVRGGPSVPVLPLLARPGRSGCAGEAAGSSLQALPQIWGQEGVPSQRRRAPEAAVRVQEGERAVRLQVPGDRSAGLQCSRARDWRHDVPQHGLDPCQAGPLI
mmetsp:Transcript_46738/g.110031  ORF Transcript_46738/g.110031 Transcript_46738/m.110031 type:complete len:218 (-) Transcript_46738:73-726(-)